MPNPEPSPAALIRVLWLVKGLGPGGAEQLLVSSARVADHTRFHYAVAFVRPDKTHLVPALESAGVSAHLVPRGRLARFWWPWEMRKLMAGHDVVHAHSPVLASVARLASRTIRRERRPLMVSTEHNVWGNFSPPTRLLNAATVQLDARRWAVSGEVRRSMWGSLGEGAEVLVHGLVQDDGPPPVGTRERVRAALGLPEDAVVALTVANLRREKDYPNLLGAAKLALARSSRLHVLAVGQGQLEHEIQALHRRLGLGKRVQLLGYRTDVRELMAAADIFVLASAFEGLPVSIMEAMAAGLPVVATAVGGVPEAVETGETGLLVPARDSAALASALLELAENPARRAEMGDTARRRSRAFDIRHAVERQQAVYAELVESRRGAAGAGAGSPDRAGAAGH